MDFHALDLFLCQRFLENAQILKFIGTDYALYANCAIVYYAWQRKL